MVDQGRDSPLAHLDQEEDVEESSLARSLAAIRRHLWLSLALFLACIVAAAAFGMSRTKIYRARATIQIDPRPPAPLGHGVEGVVELGASTYWANIEYYNTQHELIRSEPVALAVVRELGLNRDAAFLVNDVAPPPRLPEDMSVERAARAVRSRLAVQPTKESRLVDVTFEDANPQRAARILEAVVRAYVAHNMDQAVESTSSAVEWLGQQLESLRAELSDSELALHEYKLKRQIASVGIDDQTDMLKREIGQLTEERTRVRAKIQEASARLGQLNQINVEDAGSIPQMELLESHELATLRSAYVDSSREHSALLGSGKGENHPAVLAVLARVETTRRALGIEVENIKSGARRQLAALEQQEGGLRRLLAEAEHKALDLNLMEIEYHRLKRTKDNNERLYGLVLERSKEASLTQALRVNNIRLLSRASTAKEPVEPRMALILAAGAILGLFLGFGAAVGREQLDRSVKSNDEIEKRLRLAPLGALPDLAGSMLPGRKRALQARPELLALSQPGSAFAEHVRAIRTSLLFMSPDRPFRRILITSAVSGEGKTTVACSLGIAMAQAGHKVLLVDADLRRPRLHQVFPSQSARMTLSETLLNPTRGDSKLLATDVAGLSVLVSGPTPPNPAELLHSEALRELFSRLESEFDYVVVDSPPLLVTDAAILSTLVDGTILVIRSGFSERKAVTRAKHAIRDVGGRVVGAVLNGQKPDRKGYGYGYGYGPTYAPVEVLAQIPQSKSAPPHDA